MSPHIYIFNGHVIATHTRWCLIWFLWQGKAKVVDDLQTAWQKIRSDEISLKLKLQDFCSMDLIFFIIITQIHSIFYLFLGGTVSFSLFIETNST